MAEEVRDPQRNLPRAIFLTLICRPCSTCWWSGWRWWPSGGGACRSPGAAGPGVRAPDRRVAAHHELIAVVATLNGIIVQIIMASRVLYGLGPAGQPAGRLRRGQRGHAHAAQRHGRHDGAGAALALMLPLRRPRRSDVAHHARRVRDRQSGADPHQGGAISRRRRPRGADWVPWAALAACVATARTPTCGW